MTDILTGSKTTSPEHTRAGIRLTALRDLYGLCTRILGYRDMTEVFHRPILTWSQHNPAKKKLVMAPRGTYKSSGHMGKRVQYILNHPERSSLLASNKSENAQKFLEEIKGHLRNELLVWAFPEILWTDPDRQAPMWTRSAITVRRPKGTRPRKEATIETNGVEGELVSNHYEAAGFDDLVGFENSQTRTERLKVIDWYEAAQALVDQPTPDHAEILIYGTPWDHDDLYAHLLKKKTRGEIALAVYKMPCWVRDPEGTDVVGRGPMRATFSEKLSVSALMQLRRTMPMRFAAQYELTPSDPDSAVFKRVLPDLKHPYGLPVVKPRRECPPVQTMWLAMTVDPAISVKGWSDYSALCVCGWDHENTQHVLWLRWGRWSETQLIDELYRAYNVFAAAENPPTVIGFETVGFQKLYKTLLTQAGEKRGQFLPITGLARDTKQTKQTRQLVLEPGWNAGELVLYDDLDALDDLLDMASKFRASKELTRDDLLDVLADNHQLRVRPGLPTLSESPLDPAYQSDLALEDAIRADRLTRRLAPLSEPDLALARLHLQTLADADAAREQMIATDAFGGLFG